MKAPSLARLAGHFGAGILDQVLLSAANFFAGLLLIRYTNNTDYGQFVLAQSAVLLLVSAQGAWLSGPLQMLTPSKTPEIKLLMISSVGASQTRFLHRIVMVGLVIPLIGYLLHFWDGIVALAAGATVIAGWSALQREYLRSVLLMYSRPQAMLRADCFYATIMLSGTALALLARHVSGILAVLAVATGAFVCAAVARRSMARDPGWTPGDAGPYWAELRTLGVWGAVGAIIYWLFAQSYNYVLATRLDLTAVADVNAARLVLMPVFVFTLGVNALLNPMAANWLAQLGLRKMLRRLGGVTVAILAVDAGYFLFVFLFRNWMVHDLLHKTIADRDRLLVLWACVAVIFLLREVMQAALFALKRARTLAWLIGVSAAVSLSIMWFGISWWGPAAALIGQVIGECVNLAGLAVLLRKQVILAR